MRYDASWVPASLLIQRWIDGGHEQSTRDGTVAAAIHAACYLADCAIDMGVIGVKGALGDYGLVHGLAHAAAGDVTIDLTKLRDGARYIEDQLIAISTRQ